MQYRMILYTTYPPPNHRAFSQITGVIKGFHGELYKLASGGGGRESINLFYNSSYTVIRNRIMSLYAFRTNTDQSFTQLRGIRDDSL